MEQRLLLKYVAEQLDGTEHASEFHSRVYVDSALYGEGRGSSKKKAEKQAAEDALAKLKKRGMCCKSRAVP